MSNRTKLNNNVNDILFSIFVFTGVKVIILVCSLKTTKLSLTHEDEVNKLMRRFQNEEKVSILELDKGKFGVSADDFLKILRQSSKPNTQMNRPRGPQEPDFHAYSLTANEFRERTNLPAEKTIVGKDPPNIPQLPSSQSLGVAVHSSVLVLRGIFRYGALSDDWGDIHIRNSEIKIPDYIFEELLQKYLYIPEVGVRIRKLGNGSFVWIPDQNLRRFSPKKEVELNDKETVILKTRVRNGEISLEESDVQFLRENIPQHIRDDLQATFTGKPYGDLYVILDDAGKFRSVVKSGVKDRTFEFLAQRKENVFQQLNG